MSQRTLAIMVGILFMVSACEPNTVASQSRQPNLQTKAATKRAFRTMTLSECDCLTQSYYGQTMKDNHGYMIGGSFTETTSYDGVLATNSKFNDVIDLVMDDSDNVYFAEYDTHRVRMIPRSNGTYFGQSMTANYVYTIAGTGTAGNPANGTAATSANISYPHSVKLDSNGNLLVAAGNRVLMVPKADGTHYGVSMTANNMYTVAGTGSTGGFSNGTAATSANFWQVDDIALDGNDNIAATEYNNHGVTFIPSTSSTHYGINMTANCAYHIVGIGSGGSGNYGDGGICTSGAVGYPKGLCFDSSNHLFIADTYHSRVRMVPKSTGTYFGQSMTANYIYTVAGNDNATYSGDGGVATSAAVQATRVTTDANDNLYIADELNYRVRMIPRTTSSHFSQSMTAGYIYSIMGRGGAKMDGANAMALGNRPVGIAIDTAKNLIVGGPAYVGMVPVCNQ